MANAIQFKALGNGRTRVLFTVGSESQMFSINPAINPDKDKLTVKIEEGQFTLHAADLNVGGKQESVTFSVSEIDKSGSTPVLASSTAANLYEEILLNHFPCSTGTATGDVGANAVAYSTSIPFSRNYSTMSHTVTGAIAFTPDATSQITGGTTYVRLVADGTNTPTYSALFGTPIGSYTTTVGSINQLAFTWNGYEYSVTITLLGTMPVVSSIAAPSLHTISPVFNKAISGTIAGYSAKQNGTARLPSSVSGTTTRALVFAATFLNTDTLLLSYDSTTGDSVDAQGHALTSFTDSAVTNSI